MELSPQVLNGIVSIISAISGAVGVYMVAKKREKENQKREIESQKKSANYEFEILQRANEKFREEIRGDWATARGRIAALENNLDVKHKEIEELKNSISDLRNELASKDKKISDMKIEILRRDLQIEDLQREISKIRTQTTAAVAEMQNMQNKHFPVKSI